MRVFINHERAPRILEHRSLPSGTATFLSWEGLAEVLREARKLYSSERVREFVVEDSGLTIFLDLHVEKETPVRLPKALKHRHDVATVDRFEPKLSLKQYRVLRAAAVTVTAPEIALQLGIPAGTVKSRLHRAQVRLEALLAEERGGAPAGLDGDQEAPSYA